ncbi:MAG: M50 family metallopeptidase [Christensenellales bacterium]|jgi:regulator of sigma E protease
MTILNILFSLFILGIIVFLHELGHFVAGRLCGIGVVEFAVGFGPKLIGWKRKGIQYSIRAIPMGGFCKFVGEDEDNPAPNAMNLQPVWKRFVTVLAGPAMNFVFAFIIAAVIIANYDYALMPVVNAVTEGMPAIEAGFEPGDVITAVDGVDIPQTNEGALTMRGIVQRADDARAIDFTIEREGAQISIPVTPQRVTYEAVDPQTGEAIEQTVYQIGIEFASRSYTAFEAVKGAGGYMVEITRLTLDALKNLVFKGEGVREMSGPVGIISFMSQEVEKGAAMILQIVFFISLNLGIMNLLPLPALDGGRLVFLIVEGIRRKPVPPEKEGLVHGIGLVLLLCLIALVTYQDIVKVFTKG